MSTAHCYLDPIRKRRNLHIETEALTERLLLDGRRCTGVRYSVADDVREACASREVVVSAGTINSPQLLDLASVSPNDWVPSASRRVMLWAASAKTCATIMCRAPAG
jgi:choline dehydrogenase